LTTSQVELVRLLLLMMLLLLLQQQQQQVVNHQHIVIKSDAIGMLATQLNRTLYQLPPKASHIKPCHVAWQSLSLFPHPQHASCSPTSGVLGIPTSGVGYDTLASYIWYSLFVVCLRVLYLSSLSLSLRERHDTIQCKPFFLPTRDLSIALSLTHSLSFSYVVV